MVRRPISPDKEAAAGSTCNVYFGLLKLGRLLERHMRIEDACDGPRCRIV